MSALTLGGLLGARRLESRSCSFTTFPLANSSTMSDSLRNKLHTVQADERFPEANQTHRCYQNYVDYYRCIKAKGEDFAPCQEFWRTFQALCPTPWTSKWDEQRENGNFAALGL